MRPTNPIPVGGPSPWLQATINFVHDLDDKTPMGTKSTRLLTKIGTVRAEHDTFTVYQGAQGMKTEPGQAGGSVRRLEMYIQSKNTKALYDFGPFPISE
jgi:hypothetical protein